MKKGKSAMAGWQHLFIDLDTNSAGPAPSNQPAQTDSSQLSETPETSAMSDVQANPALPRARHHDDLIAAADTGKAWTVGAGVPLLELGTTQNPGVGTTEASPDAGFQIETRELRYSYTTVACWWCLSHGLSRFWGKEMALIVRRSPAQIAAPLPEQQAEKERLEKELSALFDWLFPLAQQAPPLTVGMVVELPAELRCASLDGGGLAFLDSDWFPELRLPAATLPAIRLYPHELRLARDFGIYRLTALMAKQSGHFPCPPWFDAQQPPLVSEVQLEKMQRTSLLGKLPWFTCTGSYILEVAPTSNLLQQLALPGKFLGSTASQPMIQWQIPETKVLYLRHVLASLPADADGLAIAGELDAKCLAQFVWEPGQGARDVITGHLPAGQVPNQIVAQFVAFLRTAEFPPGGQPLEDGFLVRLTDRQWLQLLHALRHRLRFAVAPLAEGLLPFQIDWFELAEKPVTAHLESGDVVPSIPERPAHLCHTQVLTPDHLLAQRLFDSNVGAKYFALLGEYVKQHVLMADTAGLPVDATGEPIGQALSLFVVVQPNQKFRIWTDFTPGDVAPSWVQELEKTLVQLEPPMLRDGAIAVAFYFLLFGGVGRTEKLFYALPTEWRRALEALPARDQELVLPDAVLPWVWPEN